MRPMQSSRRRRYLDCAPNCIEDSQITSQAYHMATLIKYGEGLSGAAFLDAVRKA